MDWQTYDSGGSNYSAIAGMDPFADWLFGPGWDQFARGEERILIPFTFVPLDKDAVSPFTPAALKALNLSPGIRLLFPALYRIKNMAPGDHVVLFAERLFFDVLATEGGPLEQLRKADKVITLSLPVKATSLPENLEARLTDPPTPDTVWPANTVVVGVIDDGIAFAHERFRAADGTSRVQFFWRQDGPHANAASTVDIGREICKADLGALSRGIDGLLQDCATDGIVDEDRLYRESMLVDFNLPDHKAAAWTLAHGTHVLDLAAGYDPAGAPANMPIVAVQLPVAATADTSGSGLDAYVKMAVDYILERAARLAGAGPPFPVVINFSYGTIAGPHDGTSPLEVSIDKTSSDRAMPLSMVLPSGNTHLSRCHAEVRFAEKRGQTTLTWRVQPDDLTSTHMEIWMPYEGDAPTAASRATIRVEGPSGVLSGALGEVDGGAVRLRDDTGRIVAEALYRFVPKPTARGVFCLSMQPTARLEPPEPGRPAGAVAPSGAWKIHIRNVGLSPDDALEAWIQRDDTIRGYPQRGRQSYFDAASYRRFDPVTGDYVQWDHEEDASVPRSNVKRRGLINAIATGAKTTVVGGVYGKELEVVRYSAGGPITPTRNKGANRVGLDVLAVSDDSKVHRGVIAAGSRSGSAVAMDGTSVAAPQIARRAAELLAGPTKSGDRGVIVQAAADEEAAEPTRPPMLSEIRYGAGRIIVARPDRLPRLDPDF